MPVGQLSSCLGASQLLFVLLFLGHSFSISVNEGFSVAVSLAGVGLKTKMEVGDRYAVVDVIVVKFFRLFSL